MRVLVVTPTPTHPPVQGNRVRVEQVAGAFRKAGAVVDMVYYALDGVEPEGLEAMRRAWNSVALVGTRNFAPRRSQVPSWGVDDWVSPSLMECVRALADSVAYDAVVVNYVWCSAVLECFERGPKGPLRVLDTHDAFGRRLQLMHEAGLVPDWFHTTEAEEGRGLDRADIVVAIQQEEARYFGTLTNRLVRTIEFARPLAPITDGGDLASGGRPRVCYIGSTNPWNLRSLRALDEELDTARDLFPGGALPEVLAFGGAAVAVGDLRHVTPVGMVADVADAYAHVDLVVNPMVGGTGLKIKTVEALSYGKPILSTLAGGVRLEWLHPDLAHPDVPSLVRRMATLMRAPGSVAELGAAMRGAYGGFFADVEGKIKGLVAAVGAHPNGLELELPLDQKALAERRNVQDDTGENS